MPGYDVDAVYRAVLALRERGHEGVLVTVVERTGSGPADAGAKMLVPMEGAPIGTVGGGQIEQLAIARAQQCLDDGICTLVRYRLTDGGALEGAEATGMLCGGEMALFYEHLGHPLCVYIYGAGHVGRALAATLEALRAYVVVIDPRPDQLDQVRGASRCVAAEYSEVFRNEAPRAGGYYVIATPGHALDYQVLKQALTSGWAPRYVGMLASRRKAQELVGLLREECGSHVDLSALYTPVGLDLGGASPEEIAVSITAEIQALHYGRTSQRHLRMSWEA